MTRHSKRLYEFGPYRIDPTKRVLMRGEDAVQLPSKVFETLLVLVQHSEEVVSKDDLLKTVWPDSFVEESNLSQSIFLLRKALGDIPENRQYIVTLPGRGYLSIRGAGSHGDRARRSLGGSRTDAGQRKGAVFHHRLIL